MLHLRSVLKHAELMDTSKNSYTLEQPSATLHLGKPDPDDDDYGIPKPEFNPHLLMAANSGSSKPSSINSTPVKASPSIKKPRSSEADFDDLIQAMHGGLVAREPAAPVNAVIVEEEEEAPTSKRAQAAQRILLTIDDDSEASVDDSSEGDDRSREEGAVMEMQPIGQRRVSIADTYM